MSEPTKPRMLDLFCKAGGTSMGYHLAGWEVVGVDIEPQPNYPFEFHQADAITFPLDGFQAVSASPPCRDHTVYTSRWGKTGSGYLLAAIRERLSSQSRPYVIENVPGANLLNPIILCGSMFDLQVRRHRLFESSQLLAAPPCRHTTQTRVITVTGHPGGSSTRDGSQGRGSTAEWKQAMGIDWMTAKEMAQAIPPAYTKFIGQQLMVLHEFNQLRNKLRGISPNQGNMTYERTS